jgi:hypothetical protein
VSPDHQKNFVGYFLSRCGVANDPQGDGINDPTVTVVKLFEGLLVDVNENPTVGLGNATRRDIGDNRAESLEELMNCQLSSVLLSQ